MEHQEPIPEPRTPQAMTEAGARASPLQLLFDVLALEGCNPTVDAEGDLEFRYKGLSCYLIHSKQDAEFLRILVPNIYSVVDDADRATVLMATNYVNSSAKATKIYVHKNTTHATIEYLIADPAAIAPVLVRCIEALEYAVRCFRIALDIYRAR